MNIFNKISMRGRKEDIVTIIFSLILIIIVFTIVLIITTFKQSPQIQNNTDINTSTNTSIEPTSASLPSPTPSSQVAGANPPLSYDQTASKKLLNYFENRQILSNSDTFAKANILSLLPSGEQSGVIYQSSDISIEYVNTADIFLVEILTTNIQAAKNAANLWFQEHGVSQQGICTFPVEFYMNYDIANELRNSSIIFSPLPNGC
jgi:cytoskeletal protein RodZ